MRFVKFALVGLSNTAITFAVFNVLVRWLGLPLPTVVASMRGACCRGLW